jgi:glycosyl transferase family 1
VSIYVYPADTEGCGHFRLIWPARELIRRGHDVKLIMPHERNNIRAEVDPDGQLKRVYYPDDAEVIVFQRVSHRFLAAAVPLIRRQGTAVVVDMDDDLSNIHPHNPAWLEFHPKSGLPDTKTREHNWANAQRACESASLVTLSADALAPRYARHGNFEVLRNCVPTRYLGIEHVDSDVFGWGGSLASHPTDLDVLGNSVTRLQREGRRFKIIGHPGGIKQTLRLDDEPESSGIIKIDDWPVALTSLGVGLAPLADNVFNRSKSWLKPLEYAALGVPVIMSPRAEYVRFHTELGIGVLARKPADWLRKIRVWLDSVDARVDQSERGRLAAARWTYEERAEAWLQAWQRAGKIG